MVNRWVGLDGVVDQEGPPGVCRDLVGQFALNGFGGERDFVPRKRALATAFGDVDWCDGFLGTRCPGSLGYAASGGWKTGKGTLCDAWRQLVKLSTAAGGFPEG